MSARRVKNARVESVVSKDLDPLLGTLVFHTNVLQFVLARSVDAPLASLSATANVLSRQTISASRATTSALKTPNVTSKPSSAVSWGSGFPLIFIQDSNTSNVTFVLTFSEVTF